MNTDARSHRLRALMLVGALLWLPVSAEAQRPGDDVPASHPSRSILARPVFTSEAMVKGAWRAVEVGSGARTISGEPVAYEIQITDSDIVINGARDVYGPRTFGIVTSRRVESWVEYELRGQGGTYFLTAQLGRLGDGYRDAMFVLSAPSSTGEPERFAVSPSPRAPAAEQVVGAVDAAQPAARPAAGQPAPRVEQETDRRGRPRRVTARAEGPKRIPAAELMRAVVTRKAPIYPSAARTASVEGTVVVEVVVGPTGAVVAATAIAGPALLRPEAERAAREWHFRPFVEAGEPQSVTGTLAFRFTR